MIATDTTTEATLALVPRFENRLNARDAAALMADMTDDCVFEHVAAAAVSFGRHEGQDAVRAVWESMDTHFPGYTQEVVDIFAAGDRCACHWIICWQEADVTAASLKGVAIITVRDGRIADKLTYGTL